MMSHPELDTLTNLNSVTENPSGKTRQKVKPNLFAYRFMIFYRCVLAGVGGYILASLAAMLIAQTFSEYQSSAAMSATLIAFVLHTCAFIWVFIVHKTSKATLGIIIPVIALYVCYQLLGK